MCDTTMLIVLLCWVPLLVANPLAIAQFIHMLTKDGHKSLTSAPVMPEGWTSCGADTDAFQLYSVEISPNPPKRGAELRVRVRGWLREPIERDEQARLSYVVHYGGIELIREEGQPICEALKEDPILPQCPIPSKWWDYEYRVQVSSIVPMGTYSVEAHGEMSQTGRPLFCLKGETRIALFS